jgi:hypothetical protein
MYWPNGIPRVYAVNGPRIKPQPIDDDVPVQDEGELLEEKVPSDSNGSKVRSSTDETPTSWAEESINDLCVSRGGYLFATMTPSSIVIWQTKVCLPLRSPLLVN